MPYSKQKMFDRKMYVFFDEHPKKAEAKAQKSRMRQQGYSVRITNERSLYVVWVRKIVRR